MQPENFGEGGHREGNEETGGSDEEPENEEAVIIKKGRAYHGYGWNFTRSKAEVVG